VKSCRICRADFEPRQPLQVVCGLPCARKVPIVARKQAKDERKATRARIDELRPLSYWVRARDAHRPCVSCHTPTAPQWDAGHFRTTAAAPELRFDENNVHKQCSRCNDFLSGNLIPYRDELIRRIGRLGVAWLEGPHEPKRYRADELKAIRDDYRGRLKGIRNGL
jgi:hypothetical protein